MAVKEIEDVINDKIVYLAEGVVEQISFKEIAGGADRFGNTHRAGVKVGDDWINNINIKVKDGFDPQVRFNTGTRDNPEYQTLEVGDKVKITVEPSEYNGKTYYNSGVSKIRLVKKGSGVATKTTPSGGTVKEAYKPKDMSGVHVGHAVNGGLNISRNADEMDTVKVIDNSKSIHSITVKLKEVYAKKNPDMSDYDVGAAVGHAVLNATRDLDNVDDVEEYALWLLEDVVPEISKFVKESGKEEVAEKPQRKAPVKKAGQKEKKQVVSKETVDDKYYDDALANDDGGGFEDFDSDIPF